MKYVTLRLLIEIRCVALERCYIAFRVRRNLAEIRFIVANESSYKKTRRQCGISVELLCTISGRKFKSFLYLKDCCAALNRIFLNNI